MQNPKFAFKVNFGFLCLMRMREKIRQRYNVPLSRINQCNAEPFVSENGVFGGKRRQLRFLRSAEEIPPRMQGKVNVRKMERLKVGIALNFGIFAG